MGWNVPAAEKRRIAKCLRCRYLSTSVESFDTVVVDVPAVFRATVGKFRSHFTPIAATRIFVRRLRDLHPTASFVWCFDDPTRVPEERIAFYSRRYPLANRLPRSGETLWNGRLFANADVPVDDDFEVTATFMNSDATGSILWSRAFGNPVVKHKLWQTLAFCLAEVDTGIIDGPDGIVVNGPTPNWQWGEADAKAIHWALISTGKVCIETIDWDMFIQVLLLGTDSIVARMGTVFVDGDNEYYSTRKKSDTATAVHEFIVAPSSPRRTRIHLAFWCLCYGGVDYCESIKNKKLCVAHLVPTNADRFIKEGFCKSVRVISVELPPELREHPSISGILYCLLYYLSWNPNRLPAGPVLSHIQTSGLMAEDYRSNDTGLTPRLLELKNSA